MGGMRGVFEPFTTKNISVVKNLLESAFAPVGYPGGAGHGIITNGVSLLQTN